MRMYSLAFALMLAACSGGGGDGDVVTPAPTPTPGPGTGPTPTPGPSPTGVVPTPVASLASPWAMVFLPDGRLLVTEKGGTLRIVTQAGAKSAPINGVPAVAAGGQGGLADVALHPNFAANRLVYLSYAESGAGGAGLAVARGTLTVDGTTLANVSTIWRQTPKVSGANHFGGRLAFGPDGKLYISAGERQKGAPAQDLSTTLGKILRLNDDGTIPPGNPFTSTSGAQPEIWSYGHRNPYGLVFDSAGQLWESEMGPLGGDEINLVRSAGNYGWPNASNGSDYDGTDIPDHRPGDGYVAPVISWSPVIAPAGMILYSGTLFAGWQGDAILTGLVSGGLVRVRLSPSGATEQQRIDLGGRIREIEQGPDGALWVLEDGDNGRLLKLTPKE